MSRAKYPLWATGNFTMFAIVFPGFWIGSPVIPTLWSEGAWYIAIPLALAWPVGTMLWALWILGQGLVSVQLAKGHGTAHLAWDRYGPTIVLDSKRPATVRWHERGLAALLPGWWGYAAAVLATASGGCALAGPWFLGWPGWASILFGLGWVAGWVWYLREVGRRVRRRR